MNRIIQTKRSTLTASVLATALSVAACDMAPDYGAFPAEDDDVAARVSKEEATQIAKIAFSGINESDYEKWSTRWDAALLEGIPEENWLEINAALIEEVGLFEEILEVRMNAADTEGYVRFSFLVQFERALLMYVHVYPEDGDRIVGLFLQDPYATE